MAADLLRLKDMCKWSQDELADRLGVTQGYVSRLLNGKHKAGNAIEGRIAALLEQAESTMAEDDLMRRVADAAQRSAPYRRLLLASLTLFENIRS